MRGRQLKTVLFLTGVAMSAPAAHAAGGSPFIESRTLVLQRAGVRAEGVDSAAWRGKVTLHGRLSLDLDRIPDAPGDPAGVESALSFMPDDASLRTLPVVDGDIYPGAPNVIGLAYGKLPDLRMQRFLPRAALEDIARQGFGHYEWRATLSIRQLETSNGCDARGFYSHRYRITVERDTMTHGDRPENLGC
jgi:hypothetical protein